MAVKSDQTYYEFGLKSDTLSTALGGGIPKGAIVLITGKFGSGRSVISQRFTYGFLKNGFTVTYISSETNTKSFMNQMNSLNYPIQDEIFNQQLKYVPANPLIGNPFPREKALSRLIEGDGLYDRNITFIDTLSALIDDNTKDGLPIEALSFFKKTCSKGKTLVLTMNPKSVEDDVLIPYMSAADIYFQLDYNTVGGYTERTINVRRFTTARGRMKDVIKYRIEPNAGFVVDITRVT
ncbi:MAG: ATPase domain-containing protein [Thermoplasmata archaeon]